MMDVSKKRTMSMTGAQSEKTSESLCLATGGTYTHLIIQDTVAVWTGTCLPGR